MLRIEPEHHAALREAAEESGLSLNEYCARKLAVPGANVAGPSADAIRKVLDALGDAVVGIVAFGSWARKEMADRSDVDLLVIVEDRLPIRRDLYGEWDASPLSWNSRRVEPHFVHLPASEDAISGLWAEAAVDGVVLFERDLRISRRLVEIRREIVAGRPERRECHGHPYWVKGGRDHDHMRRAGIRLRALDLFFDAESWADVVRESQEIVELSLKALLRSCGIDPPRVHDVSDILLAERARLPRALEDELDALVEASRTLRRDRELAFYGAEDLTPSDFYSEDDADRARAGARLVVEAVEPHVTRGAGD